MPGFELPEWFVAQGLVAWPLLLCSVVTVVLLLERCVMLLGLPRLGERHCRAAAELCQVVPDGQGSGDSLAWEQGVYLLQAHALMPRSQREELLSVWLASVQQRLQRRLRMLQLIGVLSPIIGLLGTVLGTLSLFQSVVVNGGPVSPAILADGLFQALYSTAWGLLIALPALGGGQALWLWAGGYVERLQQLLNRCLLVMDGIGADALAPGSGKWVRSRGVMA